MADNLTVRTGTGESIPGNEVSGAKEIDKGRGELDKLRDLAKTRHGKHLDDKTLAAIATRRKAKLAHEQRITESKTSFESTQGRESVTSKAAEHETRAQKATGTAETRGADGLTEQERTTIRSDPKAGPKLPPADTKATTPDQANALLARMSSLLVTDGKPFDVEAYAKTLKSAPPTQSKAAATKGQAQPPALARQASAMTAKPAGQPGALPREGSSPAAGLGAPVASAKLGFRATHSDTSLNRTGAINDGLVNAGGGFVTGTRFDGMSFNWDAFFSLFLIRSQEDLNIWRRLMKELAAAEGKLSVQGRDLQIALTKMRQAFGRVDANLKFQQNMEALGRKLQQGPVYEILGQNPDAVPGLRKQIEETLREIYANAGDKAAPFKGRVYLTDQELDALGTTPELEDLKEAYRAQLSQIENAGADLATLGLMMDDRTQVRTQQADLHSKRSQLMAQAQQTPQQQASLRKIDAELRRLSETDQRLGQAIDATRSAIDANVVQAMSNPEVAAFLNARRDALSNGLREVRAQQHELRNKEPNTTLTEEERAEDQQKSEALEQREASLLRQIVVLDTAMAAREIASPEQKEAYDDLLNEAQRDLVAANEARDKYRAEVQAILADDDQPSESNAPRVAGLRERQERLAAEHGELRVALAKNPDNKDELQRELRINESLQEVLAEEIRLSQTDTGAEKRTQRLTLARGNQTVPPVIQDWVSSAPTRADRLHHLIRGDEDHAADPEGTASHAGAHVDLVNVWSPYDPAYRRRLSTAVEAGNEVAETRRRHLPDPNADEIHGKVRDAIRSAGEGPMIGAVDSAVQNAISLADRHRKELDAAMRQHVQQGQGMINQLIQLLGMSRAR